MYDSLTDEMKSSAIKAYNTANWRDGSISAEAVDGCPDRTEIKALDNMEFTFRPGVIAAVEAILSASGGKNAFGNTMGSSYATADYTDPNGIDHEITFRISDHANTAFGSDEPDWNVWNADDLEESIREVTEITFVADPDDSDEYILAHREDR